MAGSVVSDVHGKLMCKTKLDKYPAIRAWNALPEDIKLAPSVASFKYRLNRDNKKPPRYFNAGTRIGQILQARMRMECSSLNSHLYRKNIVPDRSIMSVWRF